MSAPFLSFDMNVINKDFSVESQSGIPSGNPEDYLMEDTRAVDEPIPGSSLFNRSSLNDSRHISEDRSGAQKRFKTVAAVGNTESDDTATKFMDTEVDPFTGEATEKTIVIKTRISRKGETVLREIIDR